MPWTILMNRWVLGVLAAAVLLGGAWWKGYTAGKERVQQQWDADKVKLEREAQAAAEKVRAVERALQANADQQQKEKRDAINRLAREHRAVLDSLRERAPRSAVPDSAGPAQGQPGCTGAELSREDAEFLVGEAARADTLRAELQACYAQYDSLR